MDLFLSDHLDRAALAGAFSRAGRVHVRDVLARSSAEALLEALRREPRWALVTHLEGRHRELDAAGVETITDNRRKLFEAAVHETARRGFAYLYDNLPLYDFWHARGAQRHPLAVICDFINGQGFLGLCREITGCADIGFADAQATRYRAGHFLTVHDDSAVGKNRRAAYVLNLTPEWAPDWGGHLLFYDEHGHVTGGFTPVFNALNIFQVPVRHSVSFVAPFAGSARYSITGWLRAGADPGPSG